jgi:acyl carrier protein
MDRDKLESELKELLADMLDLEEDEIDNDTSPDTVPEWDSLAHIRLMAALEEKYDITLPPEEQVEMLTFELVVDVMAEKLGVA